MRESLRRGFRDELAVYARKAQAFSVRLSRVNCVLMEKDERRTVVYEVIKPLVSASVACYLYESNIEPPIPDILHREHGRYRVDVNLAFGPSADVYWGAGNSERGTIIWICHRTWPMLLKLYACAYDPFVLSNLGSVMSKSAIAFARRYVQANPDAVVFGLSTTNGVEWLTLFIHPTAIEDSLGKALDRCSLTSAFLKLYGQGSKG
jgi:hypothetical protein